MTALEEVQQLFFRCVRFDPAPAALEEVFAPAKVLSARECMAVYRQMYWYRLVDALFDVFPRLAAHVGREKFTKLCCRYVTGEPSRHSELERAGHAFSRFLRESPDEIGDDRACLADLAALEYAVVETLIAPDNGPSIEPAKLDPVRLPHQRMTFTPALAVVGACSDALDIFRAAPPRGDHCPRYVLLRRSRFAVVHRLLDDDEAQALERARAGLPVEAFCVPFATPERASGVLRRWFDEALVLAVSEVP